MRMCVVAMLLAGAPADSARAPARARGRAARSNTAGRPSSPEFTGRVFEDRNADGIQGPGEPGISGVWVRLNTVSAGTAIDSVQSDAAGDYALALPVNVLRDSVFELECVPAPGFYPEASSVQAAIAGRETSFGLAAFRRITLRAPNVLCLGAGDVAEKDWLGTRSERAHHDLDLIAGADASGTDQLSVWFNRFDANPLFEGLRDYSRTVPNAVLSMAVGQLAPARGSVPARAGVVIGTRHCAAGNFFTWITQDHPGSEGFLPSSYTMAFRTGDSGDVQAMALGEAAADGTAKLYVGTRSPGGTRGTIESWTREGGANPGFTPSHRCTSAGASAGELGEVTCLAFASLGESRHQLVAGTVTGPARGQLVVLALGGKDEFTSLWQHRFDEGAVLALAVADITGDGGADIVVALRTGPSSGRLELWRNDSPKEGVAFTRIQSVGVAGIPCSLIAADLGGLMGPDVAVGFRDAAVAAGGRTEIYYCDGHKLPLKGSDPSAGRITHWVPALVSRDFDHGPELASPARRNDLAIGVHGTAGSGALVVLIR